jgi:VanZ family protein
LAPATRRIVLWTPTLAYMGYIFYLSSESDPLPALTAVVWDKALHTVGYAALGILLASAVAGEGGSRTAIWLAGTIIASAYGASDEFHQSFVPGRDADVHDWIADTIGSCVGAGAFVAFLEVWSRQLLRRWPGLVKLDPWFGARRP